MTRSLGARYSLAAAVIVTAAFPVSAMAHQGKENAQTLQPGAALVRKLPGGQSHWYRVDLEAGQYLHVVLDQRGADFALALEDSNGKRLVAVDRKSGTSGSESLSFVATLAGAYRLEVHSTIYIDRTDEYRVVIEALRQPTDEDLKHVADERAVDEWVKLPWQATAVPIPPDVVAADAAAQFAGQKRIVCGIVTSATLPSVNDPATHLWLGEKADGRVDLTIDRGSRDKFGPFLEGGLLSRRACIEGKLVETPAGIVVAVKDAEQFKAVAQPDEARPPAFAPGVPTFAAVSRDPGMAAPKLLTVLKPPYTPAAIRARIQGSVEVEVLVAESGHVTQARVRRSLDPLLGLDDHAVDAAREAEFKPATRNGVPVSVLVVLEMTFKLR